MSKIQVLDTILSKNKGYIQTSDAAKHDVSRTYFMEYVRKRELERVAHGIYLAKDAWPDSIYEIQLRYPQVVFSHETALYLHDMAERVPIKYSVTMKTSDYSTRLSKEDVKVYKIKETLFDIGITDGVSPEGHKIRVYDRERTICDILRSRNNIDPPAINYALKSYVNSKGMDISRTMKYAKLLSVEKIARFYLGILLDDN